MPSFGHAVLPLIAGFQFHLSKLALGACLFFAFLPDIDVVWSLLLTGNLFTLHRGFTHSLLFACIPLFLYVFIRRQELLWGFYGALSHIFLDLFDTGGVPLFWPISQQRIALGWIQSTSLQNMTLDKILSPNAFTEDKLLALLLIVYLAYYFGSRWYRGSVVKRGRGKPVKKRRN